MSKVKLPDSGLEVEVRSLSWEEAQEFSERDLAMIKMDKPLLEGDVEALAEFRRLSREQIKVTIETACPEGTFEQIKGSMRDVRVLFKAIRDATRGDAEEEKN